MFVCSHQLLDEVSLIIIMLGFCVCIAEFFRNHFVDFIFLLVIFGSILDLGAILSLGHELPQTWVWNWTSHCWPLLQVLVAFTPAPHLCSFFPLLCSSYTFLLAWFWTYQECLASGSLHCCGILFLQTVMGLPDSYHIKEDFPLVSSSLLLHFSYY